MEANLKFLVQRNCDKYVNKKMMNLVLSVWFIIIVAGVWSGDVVTTQSDPLILARNFHLQSRKKRYWLWDPEFRLFLFLRWPDAADVI